MGNNPRNTIHINIELSPDTDEQIKAAIASARELSEALEDLNRCTGDFLLKSAKLIADLHDLAAFGTDDGGRPISITGDCSALSEAIRDTKRHY